MVLGNGKRKGHLHYTNVFKPGLGFQATLFDSIVLIAYSDFHADRHFRFHVRAVGGEAHLFLVLQKEKADQLIESEFDGDC